MRPPGPKVITRALVAILLSLLGHGGLLAIMDGWVLPAGGRRFGEAGTAGAGGDQVEIEVEPLTATLSVPSPSTAVEANPETPMDSPRVPATPRPVPEETNPTPEQTNPTPERLAPERLASDGVVATQDAESPARQSPTGDDGSTPIAESSAELAALRDMVLQPGHAGESLRGGRAEGDPTGNLEETIEAAAGHRGAFQASRALAPGGSLCEDPVAGTWVAIRYRPGVGFGEWIRFTLRIHREGEALSGQIVSRIWSGGAGDRRPPVDREGSCRAFHMDATWLMPAEGSYRAPHLRFTGQTETLVRQDCLISDDLYVPDSFSGTVDPEADRFHARNNDGVVEIDVPYTFRRTACGDR